MKGRERENEREKEREERVMIVEIGERKKS